MDLFEAVQSAVEACNVEHCLASLNGVESKQRTMTATSYQLKLYMDLLHLLQVCQVNVEPVVV